ncbi:tetratricopeptide repeat protein [Pseudonocardia acaciae]|uniref:tetratricopeptide repeat protein n=1 Tax=Pseudonocardia acaciae TaxID=551276 RepID=UPI000AD83140|nr:tetratricopeptide repeat protein [Pseudonocardia acaciae]
MSTGSGPDFRGAQGVQYGHRNVQTNIHGPVTVMAPVEISWPIRVGAVPLLAACFQDREESRLLAAAADEGGTAAVTRVLSGLGGVGKTQLAAAYARTRGDVDLLVWMPSDSRDAILTGYARAAAQLGHRSFGDAEEAARWLLAWLQSATERSWLIVLDDLVDPADLQGLWPDGPRGLTVVTTRRVDAALTGPGISRLRVDVGVFTPDQARAYLTEKLGAHLDIDPGDARMREVDELTADLGRLPLALAQAGAFILDRGDTCARYRARLTDRRRRLAEVFPPDALADDYRATVAATWSISIDAADALPPAGLARPILELLGVLDPKGIPTDILTTTAAATDYAADRGIRPRDARDVSDALRNLARFSLITLEPDAPVATARVHGLVQRATVERLTPGRLSALHRAAADSLAAIWPHTERDAELGQVLRSNAATLVTRAGADLWQPEAHPLLWRAGRSLGECGLVHAAITYWSRMVSESRDRLGPDHLDTLACRRGLADWRGEAGDPAGAATDFEELVADLVGVVGADHPETLAVRGSLAYWQGEAGDSAGAAAGFEQLVADLVGLLGADHPDTLAHRGNLARWRGEAGDPGGAVIAFEELVADLVRVLGADHPDTLTTRGNLAYWRGQAGDPGGAAEEFELLPPDRLRVLGADHPDTLTTRANVAEQRGEAGDHAGAIAAYEGLLPDRLRVLGAYHPHTLGTRMSLAHWRGRAGDPAGAADAFERIFTECLRVLGADHPQTLGARHLAARWRGEAGDPGGAAAAFEQLLADRLRVVGPDHPHIFAIRHNIARSRGQAGDPAAAAAAFEQLLGDLARVLGADHPHTISVRASLAHYRVEASGSRGGHVP